MVLGRVVVRRGLCRGSRLPEMRAMGSRHMLLPFRCVRPARSGLAAIVNLVQLWSARVDVWLLLLAIRRVVRGLLSAVPRRESRVVVLHWRRAWRSHGLPLLPLVGGGGEGGVDGVSRPRGHGRE